MEFLLYKLQTWHIHMWSRSQTSFMITINYQRSPCKTTPVQKLFLFPQWLILISSEFVNLWNIINYMQLLSLFASLLSISPCKRNQGKSGERSRHLWIGLWLSLLIKGSPQFQQQLSPPCSLHSYQPSMILIPWGNPRPDEFRSALHCKKKSADREMAKTDSKE